MAPYDWANGDSANVFWYGEYGFTYDAILGNGYGIYGQNYVALLNGSKM